MVLPSSFVPSCGRDRRTSSSSHFSRSLPSSFGVNPLYRSGFLSPSERVSSRMFGVSSGLLDLVHCTNCHNLSGFCLCGCDSPPHVSSGGFPSVDSLAAGTATPPPSSFSLSRGGFRPPLRGLSVVRSILGSAPTTSCAESSGVGSIPISPVGTVLSVALSATSEKGSEGFSPSDHNLIPDSGTHYAQSQMGSGTAVSDHFLGPCTDTGVEGCARLYGSAADEGAVSGIATDNPSGMPYTEPIMRSLSPPSSSILESFPSLFACTFLARLGTDSIGKMPSAYAALFPDEDFNCYRKVLPWVRLLSENACYILDQLLPARGPVYAKDFGVLLSYVVFLFDLRSLSVPSLVNTHYHEYMFLHFDETSFITIFEAISKLLVFDGFVGMDLGGVNPVQMIQTAASVGAVNIASNDASVAYRDTLSALTAVSTMLNEQEMSYISRERHVNFRQNNVVTNDHPLMAAYREVIRDDFRKMINLQTTPLRTLVLGSTSREYSAYQKNKFVYFQLANREGKDTDRMVMDFLKDIREKNMKKATSTNRGITSIKRKKEDIVDIDGMIKAWCKDRVLPARFLSWDQSQTLLQHGVVSETATVDPAVEGNIFATHTNERGRFEVIRDMFNDRLLTLMPKPMEKNDCTFDQIVFEDVGYNFSAYDWYKIMSNTGATVAYGYMCLPWQLVFPDICPPPGYVYKKTGAYSYFAYEGFSNGYVHRTDAWSTFMKSPVISFKGKCYGVEIYSRIGPMACVKIYATDNPERFTRNLALPAYLQTVRLLNIRACVNRRTNKVEMDKLKYFPVRLEEYVEAVNYALDLSRESLSARSVMLYARRRVSGLSLVTKKIANTWSIEPGLIPEFANVVYLVALHSLTVFDVVSEQMKQVGDSPIEAFIRAKISSLIGPIRTFYELFKSNRDFLKLLVKDTNNSDWQDRIGYGSIMKQRSRVFIGTNPEDLLDPNFSVDEKLSASNVACMFCSELQTCCGTQKFTCTRDVPECFDMDIGLNSEELRTLRAKLSDTANDPAGIKAIKEEALRNVPPAEFSVTVRVEYLCGPPGTGKSHLIRGMATARDLVLAPYSRLKEDYTNFVHPVHGTTRTLKFATQHNGMSALNHSRIFVDEYTAFPYECLAVIAFRCGAQEIVLVGDHRQPSLIHLVEGLSIPTKVPLTSIRKHELIKNYRNPSDVVSVLNTLYSYSMEATNTRLGYSFDVVNNFNNYRQMTPLFFKHQTAERFGISSNFNEKVTVRANQGATYDNIVLVVTNSDLELFSMPPMAIVALSRHRQKCVILYEPTNESAVFANMVKGATNSPPPRQDDSDSDSDGGDDNGGPQGSGPTVVRNVVGNPTRLMPNDRIVNLEPPLPNQQAHADVAPNNIVGGVGMNQSTVGNQQDTNVNASAGNGDHDDLAGSNVNTTQLRDDVNNLRRLQQPHGLDNINQTGAATINRDAQGNDNASEGSLEMPPLEDDDVLPVDTTIRYVRNDVPVSAIMSLFIPIVAVLLQLWAFVVNTYNRRVVTNRALPEAGGNNTANANIVRRPWWRVFTSNNIVSNEGTAVAIAGDPSGLPTNSLVMSSLHEYTTNVRNYDLSVGRNVAIVQGTGSLIIENINQADESALNTETSLSVTTVLADSNVSVQLPSENTCLIRCISEITGSTMEEVWIALLYCIGGDISTRIVRTGLNVDDLEIYMNRIGSRCRLLRTTEGANTDDVYVIGSSGPFIGTLRFDGPPVLGHFQTVQIGDQNGEPTTNTSSHSVVGVTTTHSSQVISQTVQQRGPLTGSVPTTTYNVQPDVVVSAQTGTTTASQTSTPTALNVVVSNGSTDVNNPRSVVNASLNNIYSSYSAAVSGSNSSPAMLSNLVSSYGTTSSGMGSRSNILLTPVISEPQTIAASQMLTRPVVMLEPNPNVGVVVNTEGTTRNTVPVSVQASVLHNNANSHIGPLISNLPFSGSYTSQGIPHMVGASVVQDFELQIPTVSAVSTNTTTIPQDTISNTNRQGVPQFRPRGQVNSGPITDNLQFNRGRRRGSNSRGTFARNQSRQAQSQRQQGLRPNVTVSQTAGSYSTTQDDNTNHLDSVVELINNYMPASTSVASAQLRQELRTLLMNRVLTTQDVSRISQILSETYFSRFPAFGSVICVLSQNQLGELLDKFNLLISPRSGNTTLTYDGSNGMIVICTKENNPVNEQQPMPTSGTNLTHSIVPTSATVDITNNQNSQNQNVGLDNPQLAAQVVQTTDQLYSEATSVQTTNYQPLDIGPNVNSNSINTGQTTVVADNTVTVVSSHDNQATNSVGSVSQLVNLFNATAASNQDTGPRVINFSRAIPDYTGGAEINIVPFPKRAIVEPLKIDYEPYNDSDEEFTMYARSFLDPIKVDTRLVSINLFPREPMVPLENSAFDAYKALKVEFATVDEGDFILTNQESIDYIESDFGCGLFDTTKLEHTNPRGHPKELIERAWSLLAVSPGVTYFKNNLSQSISCLQSRYLTKKMVAVFNNESITKANEIADLFCFEHMSICFDIFNEEDLWTTTLESEKAMKQKNYDKQVKFSIGGDADVRFSMKDIFKPFKTKVDLFKAGQGISAWSRDNQTLFQTAFRVINKHFINCLKPHVVYDNGVDETTLMNRVNALFSLLPPSCVNGVIDATACDSGQNRFTQRIERRILEKLGISNSFLDSYYSLRESYTLKGYGVTAKIKDIKTSGEPATLLNNTILMACLMNYLVRGQGPSVLIIKGDDGLKRQACIKYDESARNSLQKFLKMEFKVDIDVPITFCGYFLYERFLIPDIVRKVFKILGHRFKDYEHFAEYQKSLRDWILASNKLGITDMCYITSKAYNITHSYCYDLFLAIVSLSHINRRQFEAEFTYREFDFNQKYYIAHKWVQKTPWYSGSN